MHKDANFLLKMDFRDFFPSIEMQDFFAVFSEQKLYRFG